MAREDDGLWPLDADIPADDPRLIARERDRQLQDVEGDGCCEWCGRGCDEWHGTATVPYLIHGECLAEAEMEDE